MDLLSNAIGKWLDRTGHDDLQREVAFRDTPANYEPVWRAAREHARVLDRRRTGFMIALALIAIFGAAVVDTTFTMLPLLLIPLDYACRALRRKR
jgi:hypothetical protein